jgi:hypothetical protein
MLSHETSEQHYIYFVGRPEKEDDPIKVAEHNKRVHPSI